MRSRDGNSGFGGLVGIKFKLDFHCQGLEEAVYSDNLGMKKSSIGGKQYLDYLWELGELPVYTISGFGISVSLMYDCPYVVRIRGSSVPPAVPRSVEGAVGAAAILQSGQIRLQQLPTPQLMMQRLSAPLIVSFSRSIPECSYSVI
jgi:hypothetical protein